MTDTEARLQGISARNEAAKRGEYPGDIRAGFRLLRRDVEFLIQQNAELRRDKERLDILQKWLDAHIYHDDLVLQSDEEDGVWFARLSRITTGYLPQLESLDTSELSRPSTVRGAIDAIDAAKEKQ